MASVLVRHSLLSSVLIGGTFRIHMKKIDGHQQNILSYPMAATCSPPLAFKKRTEKRKGQGTMDENREIMSEHTR